MNTIAKSLDFISDILESFLFFKIEMPLFVGWLLVAGIFLAIKLEFLPMRLLRHGFDVLMGKFDKPDDIGIISHKEAIFIASLGTVGLGSLSGVGISIIVGGYGAVIWILIFSIVCMPIKFCEAMLGNKFRQINEKNGEISGGPFDYIKTGFKRIGYCKIGKLLSVCYAVALLCASLAPANMFQTSQTVNIILDIFPSLSQYRGEMGLVIISIIALSVFGGVRLIGKLSTILVPLMLVAYIFLSILIIYFNKHNLFNCLSQMFIGAFSLNSAFGGLVGAMTTGAIRVIYTTESGGGTTGIAHSTVKTSEPIGEGLTAIIELFMPIIMSFLTGTIILITNSSDGYSVKDGILIVKRSFESLSPVCGNFIAFFIPFLAITTVMAWNYYGQNAWKEIIGEKYGLKTLFIFHSIFLMCAYYGCITDSIISIVRFSDYIWSAAAIPNIIAIYALSNIIKRDLKEYIKKYKL